jgi:hypothetical protein
MKASQANARNNLRAKPLVVGLLLPFAIGDLACTSIAGAATLPVTNCNDAGSGSLRAALASAHSGDSVDLTALSCATISLATGELNVAVDDLTLSGPGASALTIAGTQKVTDEYSVLHHTGHGTLRIDALQITVENALYRSSGSSSCIASSGTVYLNRSIVSYCSGVGVFAHGFFARYSTISHDYQGVHTLDGNVSINNSTISGNGPADCAGLHLGLSATSRTSAATVLIRNSTISGNNTYGNVAYGFYSSVPTHGGAGCIYEPTTISNSTIAFNSADYSGGLYIATFGGSGAIRIDSSIFANNAGDQPSFNYDHNLVVGFARTVSGSNNLIFSPVSDQGGLIAINADPLLLPLADNGGPTMTHALAPGSPAIDAGNNLAGLATDQRGAPFARAVGAATDIGAFELQTTVPTVSIGPGFTGSWFDPAQSGHGLMLEVLSGNRLLAFWFAFNPAGDQQAWFGGVGTYSGNTATITGTTLPSGGRWIPNFNENTIVENPWGTLTFTFTDCKNGRVDFNSVFGYGSGSMNLTRLTLPAGLTCP